MKVTFLGTGAGLPSKYRNTQSLVFNFMQELKESWMFDCGEASQHKIMHTTIKPGKISKIFISHMHGDHVLGLIGFLSSRAFLLNDKSEDITIFGPKGIKEYIEINLKMIRANLTYSINYVEFDKEGTIYQDERVRVEVFPLQHSLESYAYKIFFADSKGALNVEKLMELGIKPGRLYREIKEQDTFVFEDRVYESKDFLSTSKKGKVIGVLADTVYFDELKNFVSGVDILVTEATYLNAEDRGLAKKHKHLSIEDIERLLENGLPAKTYLTHISSRYSYDYVKEVAESLAERNIIIVNDLDEFEI